MASDIQLTFDIAPGSLEQIEAKIIKLSEIHPIIKYDVEIDGNIETKTRLALQESIKLQNAIKAVNSELEKTRTSNNPNMQIYTSQLQRVSEEFQKLDDDLRHGSRYADEFKNKFNGLQEILARIRAEMARLDTTSFDKLSKSLDTGEIKTKMDSVIRKFKELKNASQDLTKNKNALESYFSIMNDSNASVESRVDAYKKFMALLPVVNSQLREESAAARAAESSNNAMASSFKNILGSLLGIQSGLMVLTKIKDLCKKGVDAVIELDTALIDLKKTTTMSDFDLEEFYYGANEQAKQLGVTTKSIIQSAADWSRLGFSDKHSATTMAGLAAQFAAISPGVSVDEATSGLVSMIKGFGIDVDDVLDGIMSKVNIVGNNFAVSNKDIIEGMERTSAVMSALGQDVDSAIALFTAANEVIQDASMSATALRTLSLRIRGYDEETEQLSEDLVDITGKIIDLTKTASNPKGISIFTDETQTKYKDLTDYFRELAAIWDELDPKNQTALLNDLFGKRGAQAGSAIIKNFQAVDAALEKMSDSAGNADDEMSIITESLSYKINELKETWVGFAQDFFQREDIGNIVEGLTKLSEVIGNLLNMIGPLPSLMMPLFYVLGKGHFGNSNEFALCGCEPTLHKPSNCGEALTPLCYNGILTDKRDSRRKAERNNGWPMLNHNATGRMTMSSPQPSPSPLLGLYRVGICDKREGSQTVRGFAQAA